MTRQPLTLDQLVDAVADLTWVPGWNLSVHPTEHEGPLLRITALGIPDSRKPGHTIDLGVDSHIPPVTTVAELHRWLCWRLVRLASHEAREWLRGPDGQPVFDPHQKTRP